MNRPVFTTLSAITKNRVFICQITAFIITAFLKIVKAFKNGKYKVCFHLDFAMSLLYLQFPERSSVTNFSFPRTHLTSAYLTPSTLDKTTLTRSNLVILHLVSNLVSAFVQSFADCASKDAPNKHHFIATFYGD